MFDDLEQAEKKLYESVYSDFEKTLNEQQKRIDTLNDFIKAVGVENIKRIHLNKQVYYKEEFSKWVF